MAGFQGGTGSKENGVSLLLYVFFGALESLQAVTADLQPAASGPILKSNRLGPMLAEKPTVSVTNCAAVVPPQGGPADQAINSRRSVHMLVSILH